MSYAAIQTRASTLIASKGQDVTLTRHSSGGYDTATGTVAITDTTTVCKGVVLPMPRLTAMGFANVPGSDIQAGDQQLLLSAKDTSGAVIARPSIGDTVTASGSNYTLTQISPLAPDGTVLLYECFMRGVPA